MYANKLKFKRQLWWCISSITQKSRKLAKSQGMLEFIAHDYNPNIWEAEAEGPQILGRPD